MFLYIHAAERAASSFTKLVHLEVYGRVLVHAFLYITPIHIMMCSHWNMIPKVNHVCFYFCNRFAAEIDQLVKSDTFPDWQALKCNEVCFYIYVAKMMHFEL